MNAPEALALDPHYNKPTSDEDLLALWRSIPTPDGWTMNEVIVQYGRLVQARNLDFEALYAAQCSLTDELATKLEAGSDKALLGRIAELEQDLATMNKRFSDLQGKIMSGVTV